MSIIIALYENDHWFRIFILFCLRNRNYYVILEKAPAMKSETSLKLFELTQEFIPDKKQAGLFVQKIEQTIDDKMEQRHENLATKTDLADLKVELMGVINGQKADLTKSIYFMGLVQFLAIMGGVPAIVTLMLK